MNLFQPPPMLITHVSSRHCKVTFAKMSSLSDNMILPFLSQMNEQKNNRSKTGAKREYTVTRKVKLSLYWPR